MRYDTLCLLGGIVRRTSKTLSGAKVQVQALYFSHSSTTAQQMFYNTNYSTLEIT